MPFVIVVVTGGTIVLALRLVSRLLRRRSESSEKDLFFADEEIGPSAGSYPGHARVASTGAPLRSHFSPSGLDVGVPEEQRQNGNARSGHAELSCSLSEDNLQALPGYHHDAIAAIGGERARALRATDWAVAVDVASVSSGEARRRAASVRKVRDWDDSGGLRSWTPEPDGSPSGSHGGGGSSSGDEEQRRRRGANAQLQSDDSSAASSPRRSGPRTRPMADSSRQESETRTDVALPASSSGGSRGARSGGNGDGCDPRLTSGGLACDAAGGDGGGDVATAAAAALQDPGSSVMANCSRGSGTDASVPYRSCGTGTGTLTSSSSPDASQSAELQELRFDTDSERLRQQSQSQTQKQEQSKGQQQQQQQSPRDKQRKAGGNPVEELVATGKAQQAAAVAAAAAATPVVVAAAAAARPAAAGDGRGWRSERRDLPPALRSSSPPCVSPPPPPLPPTILETRAPDPQSLLAIQRQVEALRLQHLQRQAQALLAVPAASRATPLAANGVAASRRSASPGPGPAWGGSAGSAAGGAGGGGGRMSFPGTPASRAASPCVSSSGGWGGEQWTTPSSGPGSPIPTSGLPPELRQQVDALLRDMACRQQQQQESLPPSQQQQQQRETLQQQQQQGRGVLAPPAAPHAIAPALSASGARSDGGGGGGGTSAAAGVASLGSPGLDSSAPNRTSASGAVQQLLWKPQGAPAQSPPLGQPGSSALEQQLLQMRRAVDGASQGQQGQQAQAGAGRSEWPQEATQAARMGTLRLQCRSPQGAQQQPHQYQSLPAQPRPTEVAEAAVQRQQALLQQQLLEWQRLTGVRQPAGETSAVQPPPVQAQDFDGGGQLTHGSATQAMQARWSSPPQQQRSAGPQGADFSGGGWQQAGWHHHHPQQQQQQQLQQQMPLPLQTSPPRARGFSQFGVPGPSQLQQRQQPNEWQQQAQQQQQQHAQAAFSPQPPLSPPHRPGQQLLPNAADAGAGSGSPQRLFATAAAIISTPQLQRHPQPPGSLHQQHQHHHQQQQAQAHSGREAELPHSPVVSGSAGGSAGGAVITPSEALLLSPPSFRHHLKAGVDLEASESAKRTQDWLNSTPTRLMPPRHNTSHGSSDEYVSSPVFRPHPPPPPAAALRSAGGFAAPGGGFPIMSPFPQPQQAPPPSLQHSSTIPPPSASASLRRQDTQLSRRSVGGASSHGTSARDSRHTSTQRGSRRRESSTARQRRELQQLHEKMANQPPPSALGLLSARMLLHAGEKVVPAPKTPGGRAFFVPLKHELRLEMSEQPSSVVSGSQTSASEAAVAAVAPLAFGLLPNSSVSMGTGGGSAGGAGGGAVAGGAGRQQGFFSPPVVRGRPGG